MKRPKIIKFSGDSLTILKDNLLAVAPEEGCALLLGSKTAENNSFQDNLWNIAMIWPCSNIWEPGIFNLKEPPKEVNNESYESISRKNRFVIDPEDQMHAQRWARNQNLMVLGNAHSHPYGEGCPSKLDCLWNSKSNLMIIVDKHVIANAWWVELGNEMEKLKIIS